MSKLVGENYYFTLKKFAYLFLWNPVLFLGDASKEKIPPAMVTADTVRNYSIEDVVLPLPGYDVRYPENGTKTWYQELMAQDDLDVDNLRHKNK